MKAFLLSTILIVFTLFSCITITESPDAKDNEEMLLGIHRENFTENEPSNSLLETLNGKSQKTHEFRDARTGLVVFSSAYPSNWQVISKPVYTFDQKLPDFLIQMEGPHNFKNFNTPFKFHVVFSNPMLNQYMPYPTNQMIKPLVSNQQIHREEVEQRMQNSGFTYVGTKEMPREEAYARKLLRERGTGNEHMDILNTEWKNDQGQRALVTIAKVAIRMPMLSNEYMDGWFYGISYTFVEDAHFEDTLNKLYQAAVSTNFNPQWDQYVQQLNHQRNQERMRQSQLAHNNRMAARQASFDAHQQKMKGIWAAQDANHASFMNRNFGAGSGASQQSFVNMINEQETVYNPLNGQNYQVNAFSTQNWMDSNGNLVQNNDLFYTPNGDINLNNREWVQVGTQN